MVLAGAMTNPFDTHDTGGGVDREGTQGQWAVVNSRRLHDTLFHDRAKHISDSMDFGIQGVTGVTESVGVTIRCEKTGYNGRRWRNAGLPTLPIGREQTPFAAFRESRHGHCRYALELTIAKLRRQCTVVRRAQTARSLETAIQFPSGCQQFNLHPTPRHATGASTCPLVITQRGVVD